MKTALIFAAGRGERLKPLTNNCPKALCVVQGMPLIEHHVVNLSRAGFEKIVINLAHLGGMIRDYLGDGSRWNVRIIYSPEPPGALETGGALVHAQHLLKEGPFVTVNADILTNYDFKRMSLSGEKLAHLVLVNRPGYYAHVDYGLRNGLLSLHNKQYTFSGVACYHPQIFERLRPGRFSITPFIQQHLQNGQISGELYQGQWIDIGTIERLAYANAVKELQVIEAL